MSNLTLSNFSWSRVRQCLWNFDYMLDTKAVFYVDGFLYLDMIMSNCVLILSPKRISICSRDNTIKPKYYALPPRDIQNIVINIINKYGELPSEYIVFN